MSTTLPKLNVYCYQYFCKQVAIICHSLPTFPARGTWIEIHVVAHVVGRHKDVPRKGNVDRNFVLALIRFRNGMTFPARGTWIEILLLPTDYKCDTETFPARGTWIEIWRRSYSKQSSTDVPRKGNVDRNALPTLDEVSAYRDVPRKGNVDRNAAGVTGIGRTGRRSPQGERG